MAAPFVRVSLCLLVLAGSTATTVRHTHPHGPGSHAHCLGCVALTGPTPAASEHAGRHCHVVVCGVEFFAGDDPADDGPPAAPGDDRLTLGLPDAGAVPAPAAVERIGADPGVAADPRPTPGVPAGAGRLPPNAPPACPVHLCDRARGARSGVLRA